MPLEPVGRLVPVHDTHLFIVERGARDALPLLIVHGGPGLDHTMFGDYLDPLGARYRLVLIDGRAQGRSDRESNPASWTLQQHASDVSAVAAALGVEEYAVLGHSYGAFIALQHVADAPGAAVATVISSGSPSMRFLDDIPARPASFEPEDLLRAASLEGGGLAIEVEDALTRVPQPLLACTGRHDRTCVPVASERIAELAPKGELHVFEQSGHMAFVEQPEEYVQVVGDFLDRATA